MDVSFANRRLARQLSEERRLRKEHGERRARLLMRRLLVLRAAVNLAVFWPPFNGPERCHELSGNRKGQLSMDLDHPYRLILSPEHEPIPRTNDGGLDWEKVTAVRIVAVEDTHG